MLKFHAAPSYHAFGIEQAGGLRTSHQLGFSRLLPQHSARRTVFLAADCRRFGNCLAEEFVEKGRAILEHFLQLSERKRETPNVRKLPFFVHKDGQQFQYVHDGGTLYEEPVDSKQVEGRSVVSQKPFQRKVRSIAMALRSTFVPDDVYPHYISYMKWKSLHRVISSLLQVQCTQAMLQAVGVGAKRALPAAAGLNWVLKDGLGRLGRLAYSGTLGSTFDSNLKNVRFSTSILFSLSLGLEILTPLFPDYFLVLATAANIGKSIALAAYLATSSAIHKSFATSDNLANIAAKGQVQTVVADNVGLALSCGLSHALRSSKWLQSVWLFFIFPILSVLDLLAIYKELQAVHLRTLNKVRLEIIVGEWLKWRRVPTAAQVSSLEGAQIFHLPGHRRLTFRIGALNPSGWKADDLLQVFRSQAEQRYSLCQDNDHIPPLNRRRGLLLWMRQDFGPKDVITAVLQVGYVRTFLENKYGISDMVGLRVEEKEFSSSLVDFLAWSRQKAVEDADHLLAEMKEKGWQTKDILLSPSERYTYSIEESAVVRGLE